VSTLAAAHVGRGDGAPWREHAGGGPRGSRRRRAVTWARWRRPTWVTETARWR